MLLAAVGLLLAGGLLVVLPGWLLANALFPDRGKLGGAQRLYLVLGGGILVLMLVGIVLGSLPHGETRGALQSIATGGLPNVELATIAACLALFWVGAKRGAYPRVAARYPRFSSPWDHLKLSDQQP